MRILSSKPILAKVVEEKKKKEMEEKELPKNEQLMAEHSDVYPPLSTLEKIYNELVELIGEEMAVKITDVLPNNQETIRTIFLTYGEEADDELIAKVLEIVNKHKK